MRIGIVGNKYATIDCIDSLVRIGYTPVTVFTLPSRLAEKHQVAGRADVSTAAKSHNIDVCIVKSYGLKGESDAAAVRAADLDLLVVIGWERLIPDSILNLIRFGSVGMHGSPFGLPRGRGRSPLNWSLINGNDQFHVSLIRHDSGVDSGVIIGSRTFTITPWDTIATLHFKNRVALNDLLKNYIPVIEKGGVVPTESQEDENATYYPRRAAEDGAIDWTRSATEIHQFVRALSRPYPGAFTSFGNQVVKIWECSPDPGIIEIEGTPGQVIESSEFGMLLVGTGDGYLLVTDYESAGDIAPPVQFESIDHQAQLKKVIARYPDWVEPHQREI
jgi:methionyl-tRNA formyltransferase